MEEDHCRSRITGRDGVSAWLCFGTNNGNNSIFAKFKPLRVRSTLIAGAKHHDAVHVHTSSCTFAFAGHLQRKRKFKECTPLRGISKKKCPRETSKKNSTGKFRNKLCIDLSPRAVPGTCAELLVNTIDAVSLARTVPRK